MHAGQHAAQRWCEAKVVACSFLCAVVVLVVEAMSCDDHERRVRQGSDDDCDRMMSWLQLESPSCCSHRRNRDEDVVVLMLRSLWFRHAQCEKASGQCEVE